MSGFDIFVWLLLATMFVQGLVLAFAPERAAAYVMWQYRLIGARPAAPGPGTLRLYRFGGVAMLAATAFILIKFLSE